MKGFAFEIKNNLLEKKHLKNMGIAVWLFMWLDDKITKIDEDGIGWVLGGKPVKFEEVEEDFGISQDTYTRWVNTLEEYPYINAIRTPYGISFRVFKAHKRFRRSADQESAQLRTPIRRSAESNKTVTVDINSKTISATSAEDNKLVADIIFAFRDVNPSYKVLFSRKAEANAVKRLLVENGEEKLRKIIAYLPKSNAIKFAPTITKPTELENKLGALIAHVQKERSVKNTIGIAI